MKAVTFVTKGVVEIEDIPAPACGPETVLLQTVYSGLTNGTERNVLLGGNYGGTWPVRCGYQCVSRVVQRGRKVTNLQVGDLVYTGTFPGHVGFHTARESDLLVRVPATLDLPAAALLGMAASPFHDARRADVRVGDTVLVYGAGLIGQFAAQAARIMGAKVTVADTNDTRLRLAQQLGAYATVNVAQEDDRARLWAGKPYSVVFECSGADVLGDIIGTTWNNGLVGHRARVLLIAGRDTVTYNFNAGQSTEVALLHASHFDQDDLEQVTWLASRGEINISPLIWDVVPITDAVRIYETLRDAPERLLGTVFAWE